MDVPEVDETIKRIQGHKGVQGVIISNKEGVPLKTTMDNTSTVLYLTGLTSIEERACSMVRDIDPCDALLFMRIRSKKYEIMATIEEDYTVMVIQNPHEP